MDLPSIPRLKFGHLPTPLESMDELTRHLDGPRLLIKRDDCTGLAFGGNKARKLEFLMAEVAHKGADVVITFGGFQSNHARQTAAACARQGVRCITILDRPAAELSDEVGVDYVRSGNLLLNQLFGAELRLVANEADALSACDALVKKLRDEGHTPYVMPLGGSTAVGCLGYVNAAEELAAQARQQDLKIDNLFLATGSCGTHAGLLLGLRLAGEQARVFGISVSSSQADKETRIHELIEDTADKLEVDNPVEPKDVIVNDRYVGSGYGSPTEAMIEAVHLTARLEGILLDPVYTGKAMAGMIDMIRQGRFERTENNIFIHTGGTPGLYGYVDTFAQDIEEAVE
jgi:L-cysteate sulfo-lyase